MEVGVEINQYRVIEHIGRGGMADVWSARDKRLGRTVAIKTISRNLSGDADPIKLFEREAKTIAQLEHPHILPIHEFGDFQGQLYIVMRYVSGGSLENLLERGPMPVLEVLRISKSIGGALDYAHQNKVVHLDLKPSNILMDSHETPYLADFGLAAALDPEGRVANPGAGTLLYMAPEQMTEAVLDHRADIYSFTIMLYHMLTGQMPFDATTSLALKQLQWQEDLPDLETISATLPSGLTPTLRRGTALDVNSRPNSLSELLNEFEAAVADVAVPAMGTLTLVGAGREDFDDFVVGDATNMLTEQLVESLDMELLEAVDIFSRARHAWAHGQGRFLLGVTHFMLINDYYMEAEKHMLDLDEAGMQVLLRGALEYDMAVDYWWSRMNDENRRWVALHAVRSGNAPARVRALYRLLTLPDAEPPQIPKLVAQALQLETNREAKLAAIEVLATRAKLLSPGKQYDVKTEYRGRLLTTGTRIGIQTREPAEWREVVYSSEIDRLMAQVALEDEDEVVAEAAARTIGRIRSLMAVSEIAEAQRKRTKGALRALALVRDEAPSLPPIVSAQARLYAWLANTWRRLTYHPMQIVWRFLLALLGGWLAIGGGVYITFRSEALFTPQRWANSIGFGLTIGVFMGFLALLASEFPQRLRGFWPAWARMLASALLGVLWATLTWGAYTYLFLQYPPEWEVMRIGGVGLALGFVLSGLLPMPGWAAFMLTAISTYVPILLTFNNFWYGTSNLTGLQVPLIYYDLPEQVYTLGIPTAVIIALGGHAPALLREMRGLLARLRAQMPSMSKPEPVVEPGPA